MPRWLKEALAELDKQTRKDGKLAMVSKYTKASAKSCDDLVMAPTKTHTQTRTVQGSVELGGCNPIFGGSTGEVLRVPAFKPSVLHSLGVTSSSNHELLKGREGVVNHAG